MNERFGTRLGQWIWISCVALSLLFGSRAAQANGRYPLAQQVLVDPTDSRHLWLRGTYGILTSQDAGGSWAFICEKAAGYTLEDPMMAIGADGAAFVGASDGIAVSSDRGCSWPRSSAFAGRAATDLAATRDGAMLALTTPYEESLAGYELVAWRSADNGATWTPLGASLASDVYGTTLDAAPSDPSRIYVSGAVNPSLAPKSGALVGAEASADAGGVLFRSDDGGKTWTHSRIPGASAKDLPYIAAVHPTNPDVLYVRVRGASNDSGNVEGRLLYTKDAGSSWQEIFRAPADLLGFALADGGETALVGLGSSHDSTRPVDPGVLGIYRARAPEFAFTRTFEGQVGCLYQSGTALYVCGTQASDGYELGVSMDEGQTVSPLLELGKGVEGLLQCPGDSSVAMLCVGSWLDVCDTLGVCPDVQAAPPVRSVESPSAPDGSRGCSYASPGSHSWPRDLRSRGGVALVAVALFCLRKRRPRPANARHVREESP